MRFEALYYEPSPPWISYYTFENQRHLVFDRCLKNKHALEDHIKC